MRFATFKHEGSTKVGVVSGAELIDLTAEVGKPCGDVGDLLALGEQGFDVARRVATGANRRLSIDVVEILPPVLRPEKLLGVGMNYHSFIRGARQLGMAIPENPIWFFPAAGKWSSCTGGSA